MLGPMVDGPWPYLTPPELARWEAANVVCLPGVRVASPCQDCTAAFAAEMRREGRCHGRPGSDALPAGAQRISAE
jgi:hypothetical protein